MGEVYRAHDSKLGRDIAIKTLPLDFAREPERLARLRREARTLASLNHPNIAAIYGLEESAEFECLVLELVEGETLCGPRSISATLDCASQLAEALGAAHARDGVGPALEVLERDTRETIDDQKQHAPGPRGGAVVVDEVGNHRLEIEGRAARTAILEGPPPRLG